MQTYPGDFILGATAMGYLLIGLFFLRFWRRTRDTLFIAFTVAFWLLSANAAAFAVGHFPRGEGWVYLLRLAAFTLIIVAIIGKNVGKRKR